MSETSATKGDDAPLYVMYADGSCLGNPGQCGAGALLYDLEGDMIFRMAIYLGFGTSNFAEYQALILGCGEALERGVERIEIRMDSQLVVNQVNGSYKASVPHIQKLLAIAKRVLADFKYWKISHIPRELNKEADKAAREGSSQGRA